MKVLGIETTCDESCCAIVEDGNHVLAHVITSQTPLHTRYGGVYPELACRQHFDTLPNIIQEALVRSDTDPHEINLIGVAEGPGLVGALLMGITAAQGLSLAWNRPLIGVNHVEAHLYAAIMQCSNPQFPALGVVASGGHTLLAKLHGIGTMEIVGTTVDDALGEAFDKVGVLLGLPYPGGPRVEALARGGIASKYPFKAGCVKGRAWDFSFSGLKTNVLYTLKGRNGNRGSPSVLPQEELCHIAAGFQEAALGDLVAKAVSSATALGCHTIFLGGGVAQNQRLRELFTASPIPVVFPPPEWCGDNGVMIAGLAYHQFLRSNRQGDALEHIEPIPRYL